MVYMFYSVRTRHNLRFYDGIMSGWRFGFVRGHGPVRDMPGVFHLCIHGCTRAAFPFSQLSGMHSKHCIGCPIEAYVGLNHHFKRVNYCGFDRGKAVKTVSK